MSAQEARSGFAATGNANVSVRACRVCGCTDLAACVTEDGPCHWVAEDLCSACDGTEDDEPDEEAFQKEARRLGLMDPPPSRDKRP